MHKALKYCFYGSLIACVMLAVGMELTPSLGWPWWVPFAPVVAVVAVIAIIFIIAIIDFLTARNPWQ